jgi:transmembrane sensor
MARLGHARRHTTFSSIITLAAAALLSPAALMSASVNAKSLPMQIYSTAVGETRGVVLDEWISMRMNTGSSAAITLDDDLCEVGLDHGEALFEIGRDSPRSLRVVTGGLVMSTHAAKFSLRVRDMKNMELLVSAGQVTVGTTLVGEHQWARISPEGLRLRDLNPADIARRLDGTTGHLTFAGETLAKAVGEFNRYNKRKLVIADRTISYIPIGGKFPVGDVQGFVAALRPLGVKAIEADGSPIQLMGAKGSN